MKIFDKFEQYSDDWWRIRRGVPTASQFDRIISPVKMSPSTSQEPYIDELLCEMIDQAYSSEPDNAYVSPAMANGTAMEPAARSWYAFDRDADVREVGFCLDESGRFGCSPDGMIGEDGCLEIKVPSMKTHIRYLREGVLPNAYKPQVHGTLLVTGRPWVDFVSYSVSDELPSLIVRVVPDGFTVALKAELNRFLDKLDQAMSKLGRKIKRPVDELVGIKSIF